MKKDFLSAVIVIAVVAALCYGMAGFRPTRPGGAHLSPGSPSGDTVVLRVNGEPITARDFNLFLSQLPEQSQAIVARSEGRRVLADQIVKLKVLEQEGRRLGADRDPDVTSRVAFSRANVMAGYALQKMAVPNDAQLRAAYQKERKNLETIELQHILVAYRGGSVPPRGGGGPPSEEQAMKRAAEIVAALRKGGNFSQLAAAQSDDTASVTAGGMIGALPLSALPPEIGTAVMGLAPGEISDPVKTDFGIHIFKAGPRNTQPFEQVRAMLRQQLQQQTMTDTIERLQKSARVEYNDGFFGPTKRKRS